MSKQKIEDPRSMETVTVDVIEYTRAKDKVAVSKEDPDETEYTSSFADTTSGNANSSELSDAEVESHFFGDNDVMPPFDGFNGIFPGRKKKLTTHWRNFIRPLMWRCKWTELRIKDLESQATKYDRHITAYDKKKHRRICQGTVEESGSRSLPFIMSQNRRKRPMKRRKRKKVEDATVIASYMSNHILFSGHENKWSDVDGTQTWDDFGIPDESNSGYDECGVHDDCSFLEDKENELEHILRRIDLVQNQVNKMKARLDCTMVKNAARFSSSENLSQLVGCDGQTSSVRSPTFSGCNGDTVSVGGLHMPTQHLSSYYDLGDYIMCGSADGEAIPVPDIIESTVGLLSSVDVTQHQAQVVDSSERIVDNMLNEEVEVEVEVEGQGPPSENDDDEESAEKGEDSEKEDSDNAVLAEDSNNAGGKTQQESILKTCLAASEIHFPKNKRKRGERKAGTANWSRRQPDTQ